MSSQSSNTENSSAQRTAYLQGIGCRVLRYANNAVDTNFAGVCEDILHNIG